MVNNRLVYHLQKCGLIPSLVFGLISSLVLGTSRSTSDFLSVASHRIAVVFNRSRAIQATALDISKAFDRIWHLVFFTNLSHGISGQTLFFFSVVHTFEGIWMGSLHKNIQLMLKAPLYTFRTIHLWPSWWCYLN